MSADICRRRLNREIKEIHQCQDLKEFGIHVELIDENVQDLYGFFNGPPDTPYAGGKFRLKIDIPNSYPFKPPKVRFLTRIWHPNVSSATGMICLDTLRDKWSETLTLRTVIMSVQSLLASPAADDPQDAVVASQFHRTPEAFQKTAIFWTQYFAGLATPRDAEYSAKVTELMQKRRLTEEASVIRLSNYNWDMQLALCL